MRSLKRSAWNAFTSVRQFVGRDVGAAVRAGCPVDSGQPDHLEQHRVDSVVLGHGGPVESGTWTRPLNPPSTVMKPPARRDSPEYQDAIRTWNETYLCRVRPWPRELEDAFMRMGAEIFETMFGASDFHIVGTIRNWDVFDRLSEIAMPTLVSRAGSTNVSPNTCGRCTSVLQTRGSSCSSRALTCLSSRSRDRFDQRDARTSCAHHDDGEMRGDRPRKPGQALPPGGADG